MKHYTSTSQSKKLLELGLNPESADFEYKCVGFTMYTNRPTDNFKYKVMPKEQNIPHEPKYDIPCWSLGALLEVMPKEIKTDDFWGNKGAFLNIGGDGSTPCVSYKVFTKDTEYYPEGVQSFHTCKEKSWIKTLCSMIVWLLENGFIKKESKTSSE